MTIVTTFTQSPDTVLPSELNTIQDDYEKIYQHKRVFAKATHTGLQIRGTSEWSIIGPRTGFTGTSPLILPKIEYPLPYWNPVDWLTRGARGLSMRIRSAIFSHGTVALGCNVHTQLRQISGFNGSTTDVAGTTASASITGLVLIQNAPPAGTITISSITKTDAETMPAGFYTITSTNNITPPNTTASVNQVVEVSFTMV